LHNGPDGKRVALGRQLDSNKIELRSQKRHSFDQLEHFLLQ